MGGAASPGITAALAAASDDGIKAAVKGLSPEGCQKLQAAFDSEASCPSVVFVLGGPGAGKGTFSARIVEQFGYKTLSAGDLIRAERARPGSEKAELIESRLKDGKLIPSEITVGLIEDEMKRQGWGGKYLIDGFPRSLENYEIWANLLGSKVNLKFTFLIECSEQVMEERLLNRGKTSGRSDDNIETIKKRFITFKEETVPVLELLASKIATKKINSDPGIDSVWAEVEAIFS
eukprot:gnl/TRDRNA2_/TRDRNA2_160474_c0_seq1.p1 gnl/TRDRNA2_/TRDRNA2_160474_c0~~gnl/TRDRNA2_/TRDRNA2_160474_c0_seq1.p1  ORF type:complete len:234 (-),score=43.05 gnl/TRDRNA2_/TRDRNA2_160474_c0_seq1:130-831(-)